MDDLDLVVPRLVERRATDDPDRVYISEVDGGSHTYGEVHERALRWAQAFRKLDVLPGELLATMLPPRADAVAAWLGASWAGAVDCGLNAQYRGRILEHALLTAGARTLLVHSQHLAQLAEVPDAVSKLERIVFWDEVPDGADELPAPAMSSEELLDSVGPDRGGLEEPMPWNLSSVIFTSGTTGPAKAVRVPWPQLYCTATGLFPVEEVRADDVFYSPFPMNHIAARMNYHLMALCNGRVVTRDSYSATAFWSDVRDHGCTLTTLLAPALLLQAPPRDDDASVSLRLGLMAPIIPEWREFASRFGVRLRTAFGGTELCAPLTGEVNDTRSCGKVRDGYPGVEIRIVDEHDRSVPTGSVGQMILRTSEPWTMNAGYLGNPEATATAWRNGWFHTGDAFSCDEDGNYSYVDRMKDAIRRRAENISSMEVESFVNDHPAVLESAAVGVPAEWGEEEVKVCVVVQPGSQLDAPELLEFLVGCMPRYMVPRYVEFIDSLPRTAATQRIQKFKLRENALNDRTWDREAATAASKD